MNFKTMLSMKPELIIVENIKKKKENGIYLNIWPETSDLASKKKLPQVQFFN